MSASNHLKTETSDLHAAVEQSIDWADWLGSIARYEQFLMRLIEFLPAVDQRLDELLSPAESWFETRRKGTWAWADLQDLKASGQLDAPSSSSFHTMAELTSQADRFAWISDPPTAAGVLYVLEGSTMGGQQLCRIVQAAFPPDASVPLRYLNGYGDQTVRRWRETKAWLDRFLLTSHDQTIALEAAKRMFVVFEEQLGSKK